MAGEYHEARRDRLEDHDRWEDAHTAALHAFTDRTLMPHWQADDIRYGALLGRVVVLERRGDRFDAVITTVRVIGVGLGVLITAFGGAILLKLGGA